MSVRDQVGGQGSQRQMVWASKEMKHIDVTNRSIFDLFKTQESLKNRAWRTAGATDTSQLGVTLMSGGTTSSATGACEAGLGSASKPASKSKSSSSKKEKTLSCKEVDNVFSFLLLEDFNLEAGLEAKPVASPTPVALHVVPDIEVTPN